VNVPVRRVTWPRTVRIIRSIHPPIDLFEDIADPADWEALASAEAKFNPRIRDSIGDLSKVPVARRVTGPGASWVMAPFVHCSPLRPGRFSDGSYGLYYALIGSVDADLDDASGRADLLDPDDYRPSQVFGAERRAAGSNGITWPSVRYPDGHCIAVFWPDVIPIPTQGGHFAYHWNGTTVDFVKRLETGEVMAVI